MMQVFVTGATGLVGSALVRAIVAAGHGVVALSRRAVPRVPTGVRVFQGDPVQPGPWQDVLASCDACVHLAGEAVVGGRWTDERKIAIRESRVASTRLVADVIAKRGPSVLVSSSAIGYYGPRGDEPLDESSPPGRDFLADVCQAWEDAARPAARRARVVLLRTGIVLAREGSALQQMVVPFRYFVGGPIGKGRFWQSWIHIADEIALILWALENDAISGPLNATAPNPVTNREFAKAIGRALRRPAALSVPPAAVRIAFGEVASVIATGQRVMPRKALDNGFSFEFPSLDAALADLLSP